MSNGAAFRFIGYSKISPRCAEFSEGRDFPIPKKIGCNTTGAKALKGREMQQQDHSVSDCVVCDLPDGEWR